jgi:menaquinol-cytochrome c reductase iron-sulfur subunit
MTDPAAPTDFQAAPPEPPRRNFLKKAVAVIVGTVVAAVPAAAAILVFIDPVRRKRGDSAGAEFVPVTPLDAVPADGTPQRFQVIADRTDAWTKYRNVPLGAVYVKRAGDRVIAYNALCPHAGCFVDVARDGKSFHCPCHNSGFNADGSLRRGAVSPRPMDELEVDTDALKLGVVKVKFQNFVAGTAEKISVS